MGKIVVIPNSNFSRNRIVKVDITKQVEKIVYDQTSISYSPSTVSSLKNNNQ